MTGSESTHDRATTTEQIAAARTAASKDSANPAQHTPDDEQAGRLASATQAAAGDDLGRGDQPPAQLLAGDELQSILVRW